MRDIGVLLWTSAYSQFKMPQPDYYQNELTSTWNLSPHPVTLLIAGKHTSS